MTSDSAITCRQRMPRLSAACPFAVFRHITLLLLTVSASGCHQSPPAGPPRAAVTGTVTLDGKPVAAGVIRFVPLDDTGGPKTSAAVREGRFELPADSGPVVGRHRVEIESPPGGHLAFDDEQALRRLEATGRKKLLNVVRIPASYSNRSPLAAVISDVATNTLTFNLVSKPR